LLKENKIIYWEEILSLPVLIILFDFFIKILYNIYVIKNNNFRKELKVMALNIVATVFNFITAFFILITGGKVPEDWFKIN
jgi:hypothetical protein